MTAIDPKSLGVILIDTQPFFIDESLATDPGAGESLLVRLEHLLMLSKWAELPLIATFERPLDAKGGLPDRLNSVFPAGGIRLEKDTFDCTREPPIAQAIQEAGVRQFAVAGSETDVCVLQSVLGLLSLGYEVFVVEDCVFTSDDQPRAALDRMYRAGALPITLKTLTYEVVADVGSIPWTTGIERVSDNPISASFTAPERWPLR